MNKWLKNKQVETDKSAPFKFDSAPDVFVNDCAFDVVWVKTTEPSDFDLKKAKYEQQLRALQANYENALKEIKTLNATIKATLDAQAMRKVVTANTCPVIPANTRNCYVAPMSDEDLGV